MSQFPPDFLDELRARAPLEEIVGRRVKLQRRGREYVGLSPFQKEKTPSFTVVPEKGFFHCFSSGVHGDVFDFLMKVEGLSFPEAVERVAAEVGMAVPAQTPENQETARRRRGLIEANEAACAYFEKALRMPEGREGLDYLRRRGLDAEVIERFRLGFALGGRGGLKAALARAGIDEETMLAAGLIRRPEDGRPDFEYFRQRVIFPIVDGRGRVVAFGGRTLGDGQPKYLNSPETPVFTKRRVLYGLAQALPALRESRAAIVAEGYMDVIALHRAGFANAVAPLGTALTEEQMSALWRIAPEPLLCFDGDEAGQRAAGRVAERALPLVQPGYGVRFALLPPGEDPDSLLRARGRQAFEAVLAETQSLSEVIWRLETQGRGLDTPEAVAAVEARLRAHAVRIREPSLRAHFLREFKDRLWRTTRRQGGAAGRARAPAAPVARERGPSFDAARGAQQVLLAALLNHPDLFDEVGEDLGRLTFADARLDGLRQALIALCGERPDIDRDGLIEGLSRSDHGEVAAGLLREPLIAGHSRIGARAAAEEVRATWAENAHLLSAAGLAMERERVKASLTEALTEEVWLRQQSILRTVLEEDGG
jgi:DNA primase